MLIITTLRNQSWSTCVCFPSSGATVTSVVSLAGVKVEQGAKVIVCHGVLVLVGGDLVGADLSDSVGDWVSNSKTKAVTNMSESVCLGSDVLLAMFFT